MIVFELTDDYMFIVFEITLSMQWPSSVHTYFQWGEGVSINFWQFLNLSHFHATVLLIKTSPGELNIPSRVYATAVT